MSVNYLSNLEIEKVLEDYLNILKERITLKTEKIKVIESYGRISSKAVYANISAPHYNASAMDGIAVNARDTFGATETTPVFFEENVDFVRIDTGDPLPDNFDSVIMIEDVISAKDSKVRINSAIAPWQNVRQIGEDICQAEIIITANTKISPIAVGAMLAGGCLELEVYVKPVVGIIPTGDEIVMPCSNPKRGEIIEFNSSIFKGMLEEVGAEVKIYPIVNDKLELLKEKIALALKECDMILVNAGSSAGRDDVTSKAIREIGEVFAHGISIKPGKPTILGFSQAVPIIGVPGYPVSGIIVLEKIVKEVMKLFCKSNIETSGELDCSLSRKIVSTLKYKEYIRVNIGNFNNKYIAYPITGGAGVVSSYLRADGILEVPYNSEGIDAGSNIRVNIIKDLKEIDKKIVLIGSHDPLIDSIMDLLKQKEPESSISSTHTGSLGGIMAVKKGQAHLAGVHLLDEETGEYNISYVQSMIKDRKVALVNCVERQQGIIVQKNNPLNISGLLDLVDTDKKVSFLNRQKGSGTRVLLDYLLKKENIEPKKIFGYNREEYTHMSIGAKIAAGFANAGLATFSAAKIYGLDFIPLARERYDFLVPYEFIEGGKINIILEILKSKEFENILNELGGYYLNQPGNIRTVL